LAAIEHVCDAQDGQQQTRGASAVAGAQDFVAAQLRHGAAMIARQVCQAAQARARHGQRQVLENHVGTKRGVFVIIQSPADIVDQCGQAEQAALAGGQMMQRAQDVKKCRAGSGDAALMGGSAKVVAHPLAEQAFTQRTLTERASFCAPIGPRFLLRG
jgi:hypothetical protein